MATEFVGTNGQDLDDMFELLAEYPGLIVGNPVNYYSPNVADLTARYVRNVGVIGPATGMYQYFPAQPSYTEVINEGGEIIKIYYPPIPASEQDLSQVFAKKGSVAAYYNYPFPTAAISPELIRDKSSTVAAGTSGSITSTHFFSFDCGGVLINTNDTIVSINVASSSLISGAIYSPLYTGNPVRRLSNLVTYRKLFTVGLRTTTTYSSGAGGSEARLRLTLVAQSSSGKLSTAPESPNQGQQSPSFDVVLRHTVSFDEGGY